LGGFIFWQAKALFKQVICEDTRKIIYEIREEKENICKVQLQYIKAYKEYLNSRKLQIENPSRVFRFAIEESRKIRFFKSGDDCFF
jgi:hypothetical protein